GGRDRARHPDVAGVVRRWQQPGPRQRPRRAAAAPGDPGHGLQRPPFPKESAMKTIRRGLSSAMVQAFLVVIGLVWMTPLAGLFLSSLRSAEDTAKGGWWTVFTAPGQLSFDNYSALLDNSGMTQAFWNTVLISVPATVLVVVIAALAGYAFAWLDFPGREPVFLL